TPRRRTDPAPRPSGATLPLQGRVKTRTLPFSRRLLRPSFATPFPSSLPPHKEGRRSADRRTGRIRTGTSDEHIRTRGQCGERHDRSALPRTSRLRAPSPFGAPSRLSPGCYLWLSFGLRLPGSCSSLRHRKPLLLASTSRPGRSAGEAGSEAARVQVTSPARRHRIPLRFRDRLEKRPLRMRIIRLSGMLVFILSWDFCQVSCQARPLTGSARVHG